MPNDAEKQVVVGHFEIPEELAKELSDNLIIQTIRQRLLSDVVGDAEKYDAVEKSLIPVVAKIEAIKLKITKEFVPKQYNSIRYMWNYNGYEVDKNKVEIIRVD